MVPTAKLRSEKVGPARVAHCSARRYAAPGSSQTAVAGIDRVLGPMTALIASATPFDAKRSVCVTRAPPSRLCEPDTAFVSVLPPNVDFLPAVTSRAAKSQAGPPQQPRRSMGSSSRCGTPGFRLVLEARENQRGRVHALDVFYLAGDFLYEVDGALAGQAAGQHDDSVNSRHSDI